MLGQTFAKQTFSEERGKYSTLMAATNNVIPITSEPELGFGDPDKSRQWKGES
jgi:hypothetical protein